MPFRRLLSYILPRICAVCHCRLQDGERFICMPCLGRMPYSATRGCLEIELGPAITNSAVPIGLARTWYLYDPSTPFADVIRRAKYSAMPDFAFDIGRMFARDLMAGAVYAGEILPTELDVLLPMPMHRSKLLRRGYNQAEEICRGMADVLGIPVGDNLVAVRAHSTQTHLGHEQRASNISGCFAVEHPEELEGLNVAIVDDVITTGASMSECVMMLNRSTPRPASVSILAVGHSVGKGGG